MNYNFGNPASADLLRARFLLHLALLEGILCTQAMNSLAPCRALYTKHSPAESEVLARADPKNPSTFPETKRGRRMKFVKGSFIQDGSRIL